MFINETKNIYYDKVNAALLIFYIRSVTNIQFLYVIIL